MLRGLQRNPNFLILSIFILLVVLLTGCQPIQAPVVESPLTELDIQRDDTAEQDVTDAPGSESQDSPKDDNSIDEVPVETVSDLGEMDAEKMDSEEVAAAGLLVYRAQYCGVCHELTAAGTTGIFGPVHDGMGQIAQERIAEQGYSGEATNAYEYIYESIVNPDTYVVSGYSQSSHRMPPFGHLPAENLDHLVRFLLLQ